MVAPLSKKQLLAKLLWAVHESGWQALVASANHPYLLRIFRNEERGINLRVYIWNCTHGGKKRASDEFRIQLTGVVPTVDPAATTLLLGWHDGYGVFVGFDITKHAGQDAASPSIQIREEALSNAHIHSFAVHERANGELAIAFRPEFLIEYALNAKVLHKTGVIDKDTSILNNLDAIKDDQVASIASAERRNIIAQIVRKYRAHDFRSRVLSAYSHRCAACGIQLELIDAAHIVPVAEPGSTDETTNGIALCVLHHAAYDRNLMSFDQKYRIEINESQLRRLAETNLIGGLRQFRRNLRDAIILPADRRDYPNPEYIDLARTVRGWSV